MDTKSQRLKDPDGSLPSVNAAIDTLDVARETASVKLVKDALGSASHLLTTVRVRSLPDGATRLFTDERRIRRSRGLIASN